MSTQLVAVACEQCGRVVPPSGAVMTWAGWLCREHTHLHNLLLDRYIDHYAEYGPAAEHYPVEVDERDLDEWIDHARANYERGVALAGVEALVEELLAFWDMEVPERIGVRFYGALLCLRDAVRASVALRGGA